MLDYYERSSSGRPAEERTRVAFRACSCAISRRSTSSRAGSTTRSPSTRRGRARPRARGDPRRRRPGRPRARALRGELAAARRPRLRRVLNATGVIVHTNLGRAPLAGRGARRACVEVGARLLEPRVLTSREGARGSRQDHVAAILRRLTGAEAALVVNNNAAAMLLALAALAEGREVIVSRGELIEIGDGFRIPDVLARSGARLVEVGTTNRTRAADYERAVGAGDGAAPARAPVELPRRRLHRAAGARASSPPSRGATACRSSTTSAPGALVDAARRRAVRARVRSPPAPTSSASPATSCSAGPQAGIVVGRAELVERLRRHPLQRALRADKLTLAALEGTLRALPRPAGAREIPVLRMLRRAGRRGARARGAARRARRRRRSRRRSARVGGGALPLAELPSFACAVEESLAAPLRARRAAGRRRRPRRAALLDCRTLADAEVDEVAAAVTRMPLTVGTAGHIDHGKTTLVEALTGKNTDRLPQERERGISIDLGYAPLELPDGTQLSVVDVPGHERFVRTMVAGATGIDLFLLVIDANEGARPQTHEHLAILRLLGIERGVVALTKSDPVDDETLELARAEAEELVPGRAGRRGQREDRAPGLDELRAALAARRGRARARAERADAPVRRPCVHAARHRHGRDGNALVGLDRRGRRAAGRAGAADGARAERAGARPPGRARRGGAARRGRAAGNRARASCARGDALVAPGALPVELPPRRRRSSALAEIPPRVHVHHGTASVLARVVRVGDRYAQLRLAEPVVAARGDRVVLRARDDGRRRPRDRPGAAAPRERRAHGARRAGRDRGDRARAGARGVAPRISASSTGRRARRTAGSSRAPGSTSCAASSDGRLDAADPLDPGIPPPPEPWARGGRAAPRARAARREALPARRGGRARRRAPRRPRRSRPSSGSSR